MDSVAWTVAPLGLGGSLDAIGLPYARIGAPQRVCEGVGRYAARGRHRRAAELHPRVGVGMVSRVHWHSLALLKQSLTHGSPERGVTFRIKSGNTIIGVLMYTIVLKYTK